MVSEEFPAVYAGGGSDSRANYIEPGDPDYPFRKEYEESIRSRSQDDESSDQERHTERSRSSRLIDLLVGTAIYTAIFGAGVATGIYALYLLNK